MAITIYELKVFNELLILENIINSYKNPEKKPEFETLIKKSMCVIFGEIQSLDRKMSSERKNSYNISL